jgi:cold shock CspA family protein
VTGRIKDWSPSFGFVLPDDGGPQIFFCGSSVAPHCDFQQLRRGDMVRYDVAPDPKHPGKLMAVNLSWVIGAEPSLRELDRRIAREGDPDTWRRRQRERQAQPEPSPRTSNWRRR